MTNNECTPTSKNDLEVDAISRAQAQTKIEMNASRYTIARERGGMGQVEWSDQLIKVSDAVDIIRHLPSVTPQDIDYKAQYERLSQKAEIVISQLRADRDRLMSLSSVTPQEPRWIPVSEKLPNDRDWYLGIFKEPDTGWINPLPFICDYVGRETKATTKEFWILRGFTDRDYKECDYYYNLECVAWMPLPQPYEGVRGMTREEQTIANLKKLKSFHNGSYGMDIDRAIKALEQEPRSEWEQDHEILKAHSDGANEVLDKIRAEIEQKCCITVGRENDPAITLFDVLQIIDKYKGEREDKE